MFVVKVGRSRMDYRREILRELKRFSRENHQKIVIVPGGGVFADTYSYLLYSESGIKTVN